MKKGLNIECLLVLADSFDDARKIGQQLKRDKGWKRVVVMKVTGLVKTRGPVRASDPAPMIVP